MSLARLTQLATLTLSQFWQADRGARMGSTINHLRWLKEAALPSAYLAELLPDIKGMPVCATADVAHTFELPYGERLILAAIASYLRPKKMFEFGTFTGTTTKLLAEACPTAEIETIDLPAGQFEWDPWVGEVIGMAFRDGSYPITQHRQDSRRFDFGSREGLYDLVYVDASHQHEDVVIDSRNALRLVKAEGLVVWDDYQPGTMGVVTALNELYKEGTQIVRIAASRLAIHSPQGFDLLHSDAPWRIYPNRPRPAAHRF